MSLFIRTRYCATEATAVQDYLALASHTLLPLAASFMSEDEAKNFLANLLQGLFAGPVDPDHLLILLNQARSAAPGHVAAFFADLISGLNKSLLNYTYEYERAAQALGQSHTLLAETHRLWTKRLQAQEQSAQEEIASIKAVLQAREEELGAVRAALLAREEELGAAQTTLQAREEELGAARAALQAREEELGAAQTTLQAREAEFAGLSRELSAIHGSRAWRIAQQGQRLNRFARRLLGQT